MENKKELVNKIREALNDRVVKRVAENTGISQPTITKIIRGEQNVHDLIVIKLCHYLKIEID